jgi:hypothetical protein
MNDPNVQKHPILATARSVDELKASNPLWRSAAEIIAELHRQGEDPDNWIDGVPNYEWRMRGIQEWVDNYLATNSISINGMTDYEKTAVIRRIITNDRQIEEFIGLWRPNYQLAIGRCASRSEAIDFLMIAMDFELFRRVNGTVTTAHGWNAYWDGTIGAVRFVDFQTGFDVWNLFVDELAERGFILN